MWIKALQLFLYSGNYFSNIKAVREGNIGNSPEAGFRIEMTLLSLMFLFQLSAVVITIPLVAQIISAVLVSLLFSIDAWIQYDRVPLLALVYTFVASFLVSMPGVLNIFVSLKGLLLSGWNIKSVDVDKKRVSKRKAWFGAKTLHNIILALPDMINTLLLSVVVYSATMICLGVALDPLALVMMLVVTIFGFEYMNLFTVQENQALINLLYIACYIFEVIDLSWFGILFIAFLVNTPVSKVLRSLVKAFWGSVCSLTFFEENENKHTYFSLLSEHYEGLLNKKDLSDTLQVTPSLFKGTAYNYDVISYKSLAETYPEVMNAIRNGFDQGAEITADSSIYTTDDQKCGGNVDTAITEIEAFCQKIINKEGFSGGQNVEQIERLLTTGLLKLKECLDDGKEENAREIITVILEESRTCQSGIYDGFVRGFSKFFNSEWLSDIEENKTLRQQVQYQEIINLEMCEYHMGRDLEFMFAECQQAQRLASIATSADDRHKANIYAYLFSNDYYTQLTHAANKDETVRSVEREPAIFGFFSTLAAQQYKINDVYGYVDCVSSQSLLALAAERQGELCDYITEHYKELDELYYRKYWKHLPDDKDDAYWELIDDRNFLQAVLVDYLLEIGYLVQKNTLEYFREQAKGVSLKTFSRRFFLRQAGTHLKEVVPWGVKGSGQLVKDALLVTTAALKAPVRMLPTPSSFKAKPQAV